MNLYGPVRAAEFEGTAEVVLQFAAWPEGFVEPTVHTLAVLPPKATKIEPATDQLTKTLPHPDRKANVMFLRFSPDGSKLMGTGYPSGVVQLWDTKTWTETARIDTPSGLRSSADYAVPTPDWTAIVLYHMTRKLVKEDKDGKVSERMRIDGRLDRHDPATGKLIDSIPLANRGPQQVSLTPDGKAAVVVTTGSFAATDRERPGGTERIDLSTKAATTLFDTAAQVAFTPDGKTAYFSPVKFKPNGEIESSLVKYDLTAGKVVATAPKADKELYRSMPIVSPDGKRLFVSSGRFVKNKTDDYALVALDPDTFAERGRLPGEPKPEEGVYGFDTPQFTPDGKTMLTRLGRTVHLWDVTTDKLARTVPIAEISVGRSVLSPDGKWLAVVGIAKFDSALISRDPDPFDLPQPRLQLLDLTDPKATPRVLMLPHGSLGGVAFSPSGTTLAVGGVGGVHLIDLSVKSGK